MESANNFANQGTVSDFKKHEMVREYNVTELWNAGILAAKKAEE